MPNRLFKTAREKGPWAAVWLALFLLFGVLAQDRIVSSANQIIGPWSELVFWAAWLCISIVTVYGVRALAIDYNVRALTVGFATYLSAKYRAWWAEIRGTPRKKRANAARRWIRLSDEILAEMPNHDIAGLHRIPNLNEEQRRALWQVETNRMIAEFQEGMERARRLFLARITLARDEMVAEGINLGPRLERQGGISVVNTFCLQEWAAKLGAEGRRILVELGEEP
jgi:hypothetical protein